MTEWQLNRDDIWKADIAGDSIQRNKFVVLSLCGVMTHQPEKSKLHVLGCAVSTFVSDLFANPLMQIGVILFCIAWFIFGLPADLLTAALSILAITLTQMVLNRQNQREEDAHRRDVALHAKLDELIIAKRGARDAMAGIEELAEDEIVALRENHEEQAAELSEVLTRRVGDRAS